MAAPPAENSASVPRCQAPRSPISSQNSPMRSSPIRESSMDPQLRGSRCSLPLPFRNSQERPLAGLANRIPTVRSKSAADIPSAKARNPHTTRTLSCSHALANRPTPSWSPRPTIGKKHGGIRATDVRPVKRIPQAPANVHSSPVAAPSVPSPPHSSAGEMCARSRHFARQRSAVARRIAAVRNPMRIPALRKAASARCSANLCVFLQAALTGSAPLHRDEAIHARLRGSRFHTNKLSKSQPALPSRARATAPCSPCETAPISAEPLAF